MDVFTFNGLARFWCSYFPFEFLSWTDPVIVRSRELWRRKDTSFLSLVASHKAGKSSWNIASLYVSDCAEWRSIAVNCCIYSLPYVLLIFTLSRLTFKIYKCFIYCIQCCDTYKMKYYLQMVCSFYLGLAVHPEFQLKSHSWKPHWHAFQCRCSGNNIKIMNENCAYSIMHMHPGTSIITDISWQSRDTWLFPCQFTHMTVLRVLWWSLH